MVMQSTGTDNSIIEISGQQTFNSVVFVGDGKQIIGGDANGVLRRWGVDDGSEIGKAIQAGAKISALTLSPDRRWLVCGLHGSKSNVRMWDVGDPSNPGQVQDFWGHTGTVTSLDISPNSEKLATGSNDKSAIVWNMTTRKRLLWWWPWAIWHDDTVVAVRFTPDGDRLATATAHKSIRIYDSTSWKQLLDIPYPFYPNLSSPLAWSADGSQLYAASYTKVTHLQIFQECFEPLGEWFVRGGAPPSCIALSREQKFVAVIADRSLSFWDATTHSQIGSVVVHDTKICSMVLSPDDDSIATVDEKGKIIVRSLRDTLPDAYLPTRASGTKIDEAEGSQAAPLHPSQFLLMHPGDAVFKSWIQGDLAGAEQLLTAEIQRSSRPAGTFAQRALVRYRLKRYHESIDDAQESVKMQPSVIGRIALVVARLGKGEFESALHLFDIVYAQSRSMTESNLLLMIKSILLFECGKHHEAESLVDDSMSLGHSNSLNMAIKARMLFLLTNMSLRQGDYERALKTLERAQDIVPVQSPQSAEVSLITGWDFDDLISVIQQQVQECIKSFEHMGDVSLESDSPEEAVERYSFALSFKPSKPAPLLLKRSHARGLLALWEDALRDANEVIEADPQSLPGYERKHAALHALHRYDEAVDVLNCLPGGSPGEKSHDLAVKYARSKMEIDKVIRDVIKIYPFVLVEVKHESGRLRNGSERVDIFKSGSQFKELASSMTLELNSERIQHVVEEYFQYAMFSHVWEGKEPSYQDIEKANSVWNLDSSPLNDKLRKFCEMVRDDGYRWAWSDTCCINKEDNDVLHESLNKMYRWYEESSATLALLATVESPSVFGGLKGSKWMTRAWTTQELLAPKVIRFYDRNWQPYLGDTRTNHKESPEIMQELADTVGLTQGIIKMFNPDDLNVREKLRLASTREATKEEDVAYSLIGIFQSDIRPHYGEGANALGHLLAEVVSRSGEAVVLAWTGKSSSYNTCLPTTLAVYSRMLHAPPAIEDAEMDRHVAALKPLVSDVVAVQVYDKIAQLPPARFVHRRLSLPCIIFTVKRLGLQGFGDGREHHYRARVSGVGFLDIRTTDRLAVNEPRKFILIHPWIRDLLDPPDGFVRRGINDDLAGDDDDSGSESDESEHESNEGSVAPLPPVRTVTLDNYTRALRLLVRLQQPFDALLLQQKPSGAFKRVAADHKIVVPGLDPQIDFSKDIYTDVVDIM